MKAQLRILGFLALALLAIGAGSARAEQYDVDTIHSTVLFRVLHMGVSNSWGRFDNIAGTVALDEQNPSKSAVEITVKADSVDTGMPKRDEHLRNPDFFAAKQFPNITFKSQSVAAGKQPGSFQVQGTLTLHGVSKPLTVTLVKTGAGKSPMGDSRVGLESSFQIKRTDFGMNKLLEGVGDDVLLIVSVEAVQK